MTSSYRENLYQAPNFSKVGTEIPSRLRRTLPPYVDNPSIIPPPNPNNPFGDPPRFHDVDPPEQNPYNDPDYRPFIVTQNLSEQAGAVPAGGLLGRLLALMDQSQNGSLANPAPVPGGAPGSDLDGHGGDIVDVGENQGSSGRRLTEANNASPYEGLIVSRNPSRILTRRRSADR